MKSPWANLALLGILITLFLTGYLGLVNGQEQAAWRLWLHGIAAYALILLFIWKGGIILDAYRRKTRWTRQRLLFTLLLILLLIVAGIGLLWSFYGPLAIGGFSLVSLHIYLAIPLMLLMIWHSWRQRFIFRVKGAAGRRLLLGAGFTAVLGTFLWRTAEWGKTLLAWPGAARRFTGSYEQGSLTGRFPVVSWINDAPAPVDLAEWRLRIDGAVAEKRSFSYEDLLALPPTSAEAVLDCTGGWYTRQIWEGVSLAGLLEAAGIAPEAASVTLEAITGYTRRFPLVELPDMLLALRVAGAPLSHGHGAPLRLVIPGQRGVEWVKWITAIHLNTTSAIWQPPLPLE
ncbi:MAG: molybdopterin-dependent oxidoreductase [Anaerolineae bacterium]